MVVRSKHANWVCVCVCVCVCVQQVFQRGILKIIRTKDCNTSKLEPFCFSANLERVDSLLSSEMPNCSLFIKTWQLACTKLMARGLSKEMHHKILRIKMFCFV